MVARYALLGLTAMRDGLGDVLATDDLAALDRLLDPDDPQGLLQRGDVAVRTTRTVWVARPVPTT